MVKHFLATALLLSVASASASESPKAPSAAESPNLPYDDRPAGSMCAGVTVPEDADTALQQLTEATRAATLAAGTLPETAKKYAALGDDRAPIYVATVDLSTGTAGAEDEKTDAEKQKALEAAATPTPATDDEVALDAHDAQSPKHEKAD